ncbi:MAG: hypothetical protein A2023_07195 [Sulfuricurvum sp. GWF2_44_89]|nr:MULTISPECIES: phage replisome organizer N-terminal domain-containing protein [Sulfuricurvum]OHD78263.1 MAG: hypothetical protein A2023_07195 [Sulfuricurvum sp. GWF2_44_89]OHD91570.1 MAG: hypothetical protein A2517_07135 [Sulfuricurvum sp. RIFOXYD12_FULL_44_77]OHD94142.1 MAG: hypothetical protein A2552_01730 [Sulfuricurvum sp. RIFOXYD2_FULL_44_160]
MSSKKYYWLKLKDDFFSDPKIKKLRKMAGGDTYTIILQKIMLLSIKEGGVIEFEGIVEKTLHEELALFLDEEVINVEAALSFMRMVGFIESIGDNRFLLPLVTQLVGSESDSAERVRKLREKRKLEPPALQCNGDVTPCNKNVTTEIRDKRIELDMGGNAREAYLLFRMAGEGIKSPIAFKKTIMSELQDPRSDESNNFVEWQSLMNMWSKPLNDLYNDFCSFGHKNRKKCKEIATDHVKDFGINITPMLFEIAFYESCKLQQGKGVA